MAEYTICIVNNDPANQETLKGFFAGEGYLAVTACNCKEALALARENRFDAFLIDLEIDSGNGIALCRSIRALEIPKRTPIICFTDQDNPDVLPNAFNAGADDFVAKPINSVSLLARLKLQLKLERARQMLRQYLSPRVASIVEEWSETGKDPEPEERQVAICFTDIRGFTALSETMDPSQLFKSVSGYLRRQVELVYKFRGYIDKFNGDGIMAVFDGGNMVVDACHCALRILQDASRSNPGEGKFPIGIGIHVGRVMMGNIGSQDHLEYSCVGQAVNLAARLCGHADP
jgi:class 3 adenylate cyclase